MAEVSTIQLSSPTTCAMQHWTAEGPIWDEKRKVFFYMDIENGKLIKFDPKTNKNTVYELNQDVGQMIGGTTAVNSDGSLIIMLEGGSNAGVNYFNPDKPEEGLLHVPDSWPEADKPRNRPNDSTVIATADGKKLMVYGTMSKDWEKSAEVEGGTLKPEGGFYVLDEKMQSHRLTFEGNVYPGTVISNGLADGGLTEDGKNILFFSETVGSDNQLKVYRGELDTTDYKVSNIEVVIDHDKLAGVNSQGVGRADGANMIMINGKPAYGVAALQKGKIVAIDPKTSEVIAEIKLPEGMTNITKFAVGEDTQGKPAMFVTTIDFGYGDSETRGKDGLNGTTTIISLEGTGITAHPNAASLTTYPTMEQMKEIISNQPPTTHVNLSAAKVIQPREVTAGQGV